MFDPVRAAHPRPTSTEIATRTGVRHLLEIGHRRIAFVGGDPGDPHDRVTALRLAGFLAAHAEMGRGVEPADVVLGCLNSAEVAQAERGLLERDDPPDAVFMATDPDHPVACPAARLHRIATARGSWATGAGASTVPGSDRSRTALTRDGRTRRPPRQRAARGSAR